MARAGRLPNITRNRKKRVTTLHHSNTLQEFRGATIWGSKLFCPPTRRQVRASNREGALGRTASRPLDHACTAYKTRHGPREHKDRRSSQSELRAGTYLLTSIAGARVPVPALGARRKLVLVPPLRPSSLWARNFAGKAKCPLS